MKTIDITDMSNRQITELVQTAVTELQERESNQWYLYAIEHRSLVQNTKLHLREAYIEWLTGAGAHYPESAAILDAWEDHCNQEDIIQSRKTTGA